MCGRALHAIDHAPSPSGHASSLSCHLGCEPEHRAFSTSFPGPPRRNDHRAALSQSRPFWNRPVQERCGRGLEIKAGEPSLSAPPALSWVRPYPGCGIRPRSREKSQPQPKTGKAGSAARLHRVTSSPSWSVKSFLCYLVAVTSIQLYSWVTSPQRLLQPLLQPDRHSPLGTLLEPSRGFCLHLTLPVQSVPVPSSLPLATELQGGTQPFCFSEVCVL